MARASGADDQSLKRLGGGRWQTRDDRFTIEPQSGTWVIVDAEQTDDLGLPLVRGPFRSLGDAKGAITDARSAPPATSPLADRLGRRPAEPATPPEQPSRRGDGAASKEPPTERPKAPSASAARRAARAAPAEDAPKEEPTAPRWVAALEPDDRRRAKRTIARLEKAGVPDPEGMARRDIVGDVSAIAAFAVGRQLEAVGPDASPQEVAALLAEGRDEDLGVRWRLVDDDGRPIAVDAGRRTRSRSR